MDPLGVYKHFYQQHVEGKTVAQQLAALRKAVSTKLDQHTPSWLSVFQSLLKKPRETVEQHKMSFDDLIGWFKDFHILTPIRDAIYVHSLVARLVGSGAKVDIEKVESSLQDSSSDECFKSCSCHVFLHYAWCVHVCADAISNELITHIPKTLSSQPTAPQPQPSGRPKKAKRGGALQKQ